MAYTKTNWQNDHGPAINDENLNHMEQGIFNNDALLSSIMNTLGIDTQTWVSTDSYVEGQVVVYNNQLYKNITGNYTTTPPDEDTTNWLLIPIINSNGKIDKAFIPYFNNSNNNSSDEGYSCDFLNKKLYYDKTHISTANIINGTLTSADLDIKKRKDNQVLKLYGKIIYSASYQISQVDISTGLTNLVDTTTTLQNIAIVEDTTDNRVKLVVDGILNTDGTLSILVNPSTNGHSYKVCFMNNETEL